MQIIAMTVQNTDGSCKDSATEGGHSPTGGRHSTNCCLTDCDAKITKIFCK